jgi:hypothetical protein
LSDSVRGDLEAEEGAVSVDQLARETQHLVEDGLRHDDEAESAKRR